MSLEEIASHPLYGPFRKVTRAKEHFDTLRGEIEAFSGRDPYGWWTESEDYADEEREYTVFAEVREEPDPRWGLIAGDVIQNLRASLDQLVWGISDRKVRNHLTAFPIYWPKRKFRVGAPARIAGVSAPARALIERSQPYHWGARASDHPLAVLKTLSNLDKHQALLPVSLARRHEYVAGYGEWKIAEFSYVAGGPIYDGAEVMRFVTKGEPPDRENVSAYLSFEVAIEGRTLSDFESIFEFIGHSVLDAFDRS